MTEDVAECFRGIIEDREVSGNEKIIGGYMGFLFLDKNCLLYTSPSPRDPKTSRMPSSA